MNEDEIEDPPEAEPKLADLIAATERYLAAADWQSYSKPYLWALRGSKPVPGPFKKVFSYCEAPCYEWENSVRSEDKAAGILATSLREKFGLDAVAEDRLNKGATAPGPKGIFVRITFDLEPDEIKPMVEKLNAATALAEAEAKKPRTHQPGSEAPPYEPTQFDLQRGDSDEEHKNNRRRDKGRETPTHRVRTPSKGREPLREREVRLPYSDPLDKEDWGR